MRHFLPAINPPSGRENRGIATSSKLIPPSFASCKRPGHAYCRGAAGFRRFLAACRLSHDAGPSFNAFVRHGQGSRTMPDHATKTRPGVLIASVAASLLLAGHVWLHLGDYTAERGIVAFTQIAAVSAAFGAMVFLILDTTLGALERIFPGD